MPFVSNKAGEESVRSKLTSSSGLWMPTFKWSRLRQKHMNSKLKVILWSVLVVVVVTPEARAQARAQARERVFNQDGPVSIPSQNPPAPATVKPSSPPGPAPVIPGSKPVNYSKMELKIISGPPNRRIATINNQSFFVGESLKVTVGTNRVAVTCQEIRERSVVVKVAGEAEPRELKLVAAP